MVLLPLICPNIIDLRSTLMARTVCCLTPSTYYFQRLPLGSWLNELGHPSLNKQVLKKNWHPSSGLTVDRDSSISSELTYASAVSPLIAFRQN